MCALRLLSIIGHAHPPDSCSPLTKLCWLLLAAHLHLPCIICPFLQPSRTWLYLWSRIYAQIFPLVFERQILGTSILQKPSSFYLVFLVNCLLLCNKSPRRSVIRNNDFCLWELGILSGSVWHCELQLMLVVITQAHLVEAEQGWELPKPICAVIFFPDSLTKWSSYQLFSVLFISVV